MNIIASKWITLASVLLALFVVYEIYTNAPLRSPCWLSGRDADADADFFSMAAEQRRRTKVLRRMCDKWADKLIKPVYDKWYRMFLMEKTTNTMYCYIQKVASTSWMAAFGKMANDPDYVRELDETDTLYKLADRLTAQNEQEFLQASHSNAFFTFMIVRNPFDRILSAYRDRILDGCSWQAKKANPKMAEMARQKSNSTGSIYDSNGCLVWFPTFVEFLRFLIAFPTKHDEHWNVFASNCFVCDVYYDAIIRLESSAEEQKYVLHMSGLERHGVEIEYKHRTEGSGKAAEVRNHFYSQVPCSILEDLYRVYQVDFEMFEYDPRSFFNLCKE